MATTITDLPTHVLASILDRLPAADAARFACASRYTRDVAHDDYSWAARVAALTGGKGVGPLQEWGGAGSHRALVGGLLTTAGPLLAPPAWCGGVGTSSLGTLVVCELRPPHGVVGMGLTPASLHGGWHREPLFALDHSPAGPAARCLRRGRPPPGRGAVPDSHPATVTVDRAGGGGATAETARGVTGARLACRSGCRQDAADAQARLAAAMTPEEGAAAPPGAAGLPEVRREGRFAAVVQTLGALSLAPGAPAPSLTLTPLWWPQPPSGVREVSPPHGSELIGVWKGTYGAHGVEIVRIEFEPASPSPHHDRALIATKVTGDYNVPAGAVTFTVFPGAHGRRGADAARAAGGILTLPHGGGPLRLPPGTSCDAPLDLADPLIVVGAVWPAVATIAEVGFTNPSSIPATLATIVDRPDAFLVAWGALASVSLFVRMREEELRRAW